MKTYLKSVIMSIVCMFIMAVPSFAGDFAFEIPWGKDILALSEFYDNREGPDVRFVHIEKWDIVKDCKYYMAEEKSESGEWMLFAIFTFNDGKLCQYSVPIDINAKFLEKVFELDIKNFKCDPKGARIGEYRAIIFQRDNIRKIYINQEVITPDGLVEFLVRVENTKYMGNCVLKEGAELL